MTRGLPGAMALSLALTLVLEVGFFLLIGKRDKEDLLLLTLVNVLTNPVVVLTYWLAVAYTDFSRDAVKAVLEVLAVLTEGYYYSRYGRSIRRPYLFSVAANAFSFGTGVLIQLFI